MLPEADLPILKAALCCMTHRIACAAHSMCKRKWQDTSRRNSRCSHKLFERPALWSPARMGAMCALKNDKALTRPVAWTAAVFRPLHVGTVDCCWQGLCVILPQQVSTLYCFTLLGWSLLIVVSVGEKIDWESATLPALCWAANCRQSSTWAQTKCVTVYSCHCAYNCMQQRLLSWVYSTFSLQGQSV